MMPILWTIMIPTTFDRRILFAELFAELTKQITEYGVQDYVEIIYDEDAKEKSVGLKRQHLLERAKGVFVCGFDSDDFPAPTYIKNIFKALEDNQDIDHVGFYEDCTIDGKKSLSVFSIKHKSWDEQESGFDQVRCANPKSVIRRTKALQVGYKDCRFGEDRLFSEAVTPLLESEVLIEKPLYYYRHNSTESNDRYGFQKQQEIK